MAKSKLTPVVVTTAHRGVFFGYGVPSPEKVIRIEKARMCVYWDTAAKSVLGMAANGPTKGCRIGPAVPAITLTDVTSVMEISEDAAKAFEAAPWA